MELLYLLEDLRNPAADVFFSCVTQLGSETAFMVLALIVFWCVDKYEGYYMLTVGFLGTLLNQFLKLAFRIPRPWVRDPDFTIVESARADAGGYSFPSGHTQNAVTEFGCLARWTRRRAVRVTCIVLIVLVSLSRMYLGVHTPADVGTALILGVIPALGLYGVFRTMRGHPRRMWAVLGAMLLLCAAYILHVTLFPFPADVDAGNYTEGLHNGYKLLGAVAGMCAARAVDERHIRFSTGAPLLGQILKTALGLLLLVGIKALLKAPLLALFGGHAAAHALRYAVMVFFAAAVWPLSFGWFARISGASGPTRKETDQ